MDRKLFAKTRVDAETILNPLEPLPCLRRAFMRVSPDYFTWRVEEQERYRVGMPETDAFRIRQELFRSLFGIRLKTTEQLETACRAFGDAEYLVLNRALLPACGVGEDYFFLNECMAEGRSVLDFETLYDYDYDDYRFQERARMEDSPEYAGKPYRGSLYHSWARLFIDGRFYYASLSMAAAYVYSDVEEFGHEKLLALIPHRYVNTRDHGKREGAGTIFSQRMDADGMEAQAGELQRRLWAYLSQRWDALLDEFDGPRRKAVYMVDRSRENDPHMSFVFSDQMALQCTRFRHFMRDCRELAAEPAELDEFIGRERRAVTEFMEAACQDILVNFEPKVVAFRKKRKIIVADGALKDLF